MAILWDDENSQTKGIVWDTPKSAQATREAARPDLVSSLQDQVGTEPTIPEPIEAARRGLTAMGAYGQAQENFLAAPTVNKIRAMRGESLKSLNALGQEPGQKAEVGDIVREAGSAVGLPDWFTEPFAVTGGMLGAAIMDPIGAAPRAATKIGKATNDAFEFAKGVKSVLAQISLNKNPAEMKHLLDGGYLRATDDLFDPGGAPAQRLGNMIAQTWYDKVKKPAQEAYDKIPQAIRNAALPPNANKELYDAVHSSLAEERSSVEVQRILNTDVGKFAEDVKGVPTKSKTVTTNIKKVSPKRATEEDITDITNGNTRRVDAIKYAPEGESTMEKIVETTKTPSSKKVNKPRTIANLLNQAAAGVDISARDWDTAAQELQKLSINSPRASKVADGILKLLQSYIPEYGEASALWARNKEAESHLDNLIGGVSQDPTTKKWIANNPAQLYQYFNSLGGSRLESATSAIDGILGQVGEHGVGTMVKDVASLGTKVSNIRPALTSVSLGGGAAAAAAHAGVHPSIPAAIMATVLGESTPFLSAKGGRSLLQNQRRVQRIMEAPLGKFLIGQGMLRQVTGRNEQQ